jgi:serine protease Do
MKVNGKLVAAGFCALAILLGGAANPASTSLVHFGHAAQAAAGAPADSTRPHYESDLGFAVEDLTYEMARELAIPASNGVVVQYLDPASGLYAGSALRDGIVIVEMAGQLVKNRDDFERIYRSAPEDAYFLIIYYEPHERIPQRTTLAKPCGSC